MKNQKIKQAMNEIQNTLEQERLKLQQKPLEKEEPPKARVDQSQGLTSMNYGSPISMFNPHSKVYTPTLKSGSKNDHEQMTLEELISKIDNKRDMIKRSVREEMDDYFGSKQFTPQFTESATSHFIHQSTNDQVSVGPQQLPSEIQYQSNNIEMVQKEPGFRGDPPSNSYIHNGYNNQFED